MRLSEKELERCAARAVRTKVPSGATLRKAVEILDKAGFGVAILVGDRSELVAILTDGDVRRWILRGCGLDVPVLDAANRTPIVASPTTLREEIRALMRSRENPVNQLPIVDADGELQGLLLRADLEGEDEAVHAIVMAGGFGTRLRPLTDATPKPMLPIGGKPLLEHIVSDLAAAGIRDVSLTTHYQAEQIESHFGDGSAFGVDVRYVTETQPLGTGGALSLVDSGSRPLLVMNGDILTRVDYRALVSFHREQSADATIAVRNYEVCIPYGVVERDGTEVRALREKPTVGFLVNAGIYLVESAVQRTVPQGVRIDMPQIIERVIAGGGKVVTFPIREYWLDIGRLEDYERAQEDFDKGRLD
ncbi:MAG: nucleotidyltransferase family protein [Deltaproteobacteria bacterium]|nr:nucleotidyltransferase family protein [Deltaproteobacteria bacterium]